VTPCPCLAALVARRFATRRTRCPTDTEFKSTAGGPYERFGPADRARLAAAAKLAGADALLAWWPPRGELRWLAESEWPPDKRIAPQSRAVSAP